MEPTPIGNYIKEENLDWKVVETHYLSEVEALFVCAYDVPNRNTYFFVLRNSHNKFIRLSYRIATKKFEHEIQARKGEIHHLRKMFKSVIP